MNSLPRNKNKRLGAGGTDPDRPQESTKTNQLGSQMKITGGS